MSKKRKEQAKAMAQGSGGEAAKRKVVRKHPVGLREEAVKRMTLGGNLSELARELGVHRNLLYYWWKRGRGEEIRGERQGEPEEQEIRELKGRIATLEGALGRKALESDFFVTALQRVEGRRPSSKANGETASTESSESEPRP